MRTSLASFAILRRDDDSRWLVRWNERWKAFNLVGGHKEGEESFRDCCRREVEEELGLVPERDFIVGEQPLARVEYTAFSKSSNSTTAYTFELFAISLVGEKPLAAIDADPDNAWLDDSALRARMTTDGRAVSDTVERVLTAAGLL